MRHWLRALFFGAGILFMGVACSRTLADGTTTLPAWPAVLGAAVLTAGSLACAAAGWAALLAERGSATRLGAGFLGAQVGKYIPGGVWIGAGQLGLAMEAGVPARHAAAGLMVFGACLVAAAGALTGVLTTLRIFLSPDGVGWGGVAIAGLLTPVILNRRWMTGLAWRLGRRIRCLEGAEVPAQRSIVRAFGCLLPSLVLAALAFAVVLQAVGAAELTVTTIWAFAIAWLAGFLALGLPSGIGAREAVLIALLGTGGGAVLAACLAHRLIQIGVEALLVLATRPAARPCRSVEPAGGASRFPAS